jgi:hypothetical protein
VVNVVVVNVVVVNVVVVNVVVWTVWWSLSRCHRHHHCRHACH